MRHRPDPDQGLFRWVWADDRSDTDPAAAPPPPLRGRVAQRLGPKGGDALGSVDHGRQGPTRLSGTEATGTRAEMYPLKPG